MNSQDLTNIINLAYEAVDKSKVGPIVIHEKLPDGGKGVNNMALNVFYSVLNSICPKNLVADMTFKEPKEPWQQ